MALVRRILSVIENSYFKKIRVTCGKCGGEKATACATNAKLTKLKTKQKKKTGAAASKLNGFPGLGKTKLVRQICPKLNE